MVARLSEPLPYVGESGRDGRLDQLGPAEISPRPSSGFRRVSVSSVLACHETWGDEGMVNVCLEDVKKITWLIY
jgi:hypothetical protein